MDAVRLQTKSFIFSMYSEGQLSNLGHPSRKVSKSSKIVAIRRCGCYNVMNGIYSSTTFILQDSRKKGSPFYFVKPRRCKKKTQHFFLRPKSLVQSLKLQILGRMERYFCWPMLEFRNHGNWGTCTMLGASWGVEGITWEDPPENRWWGGEDLGRYTLENQDYNGKPTVNLEDIRNIVLHFFFCKIFLLN